jgi:hypothetical protein
VGISGFQVIAKNSGSFNVNDEFFAADLTFDNTPEDAEQVIQVQIQTDQAAILQVTLNGIVFVSLNNGIAIDGVATFSMLVAKDTLLNFRNADIPGLAVEIVVAA